MKRLVLTVLLCGIICNGIAHADWFGKFWEDIKREATNGSEAAVKLGGIIALIYAGRAALDAVAPGGRY